jgi:hypothetical protein
MVVIIGLIVLVVALIVGIVGVLSNAGPTHVLTENFSVVGYHVTGSTGTLFLSGIVVGVVALLGLSVLLAGARRTAYRGRDARRQLADSQRETALVNRDRETLPVAQRPVDATRSSAANSEGPTITRQWGSVLGRWRGSRRPAPGTRVDLDPPADPVGRGHPVTKSTYGNKRTREPL